VNRPHFVPLVATAFAFLVFGCVAACAFLRGESDLIEVLSRAALAAVPALAAGAVLGYMACVLWEGIEESSTGGDMETSEEKKQESGGAA